MIILSPINLLPAAIHQLQESRGGSHFPCLTLWCLQGTDSAFPRFSIWLYHPHAEQQAFPPTCHSATTRHKQQTHPGAISTCTKPTGFDNMLYSWQSPKCSATGVIHR